MQKIQVLLATYNGAKYITEQINSVLLNFKKIPEYDCSILISDDNSTDQTVNLIKSEFGNNSEVRIISTERKGGVRNNFTYLIKNSDADYIFFCDQDDLWLPEKLRIFLDEFLRHASINNRPLLIHSDLCVSDSTLSPIHTSMFKYQKLNNNPSFSNLIVSNSITGCVLGINKALVNILKESSINQSIMHDWYIGLIASCFGKVVYIPKSLILYRQHENNQVGAKKFTFADVFNFSKIDGIKKSIKLTKEQANLFLSDFGMKLDKSNYRILEDYISSFEKSFVQRCTIFFKHKLYKHGAIRNSIFFVFFVFLIR